MAQAGARRARGCWGVAASQQAEGRRPGLTWGCPPSLPLVCLPDVMGSGRRSMRNGDLEETCARPDSCDRFHLERGS